MTREEAIEIAKGLRTDFKCESNTMVDFCNTIIKALEPYEDCVSRKDVINYIQTLACDLSYWSVTDEVVKDIEALPSVTPIRKKGEWCKQNDDYFDWYECSECGYGSDGEMQYSSEYDVRTKYCPNCGAEMQEVEE